MKKNSKTTIICCYAPTNVSDPVKKDLFYNQLGSIIKNIPKSHGIILAGDLNARVGKDFNQWARVIGKHGFEEEINDNGNRLLELCALEELCIMNTWFQQKDKLKSTWRHHRSKKWHMIDLIIVR